MSAATAALARFNDLWQARLRAYRQYARPPWWAPGLRLTGEIHAEYERFLPVRPYLIGLHDLVTAALAARGLPGLRSPEPRFASIAAWWAELPEALAGRVTVADDELLTLACAIAAPSRFGTKAGRYPEQRPWIADTAGPIRATDIGCGTGQGTWELATWLPSGSRVLGVTREPLEVWMARERHTPHLTGHAWSYPPRAEGVDVAFRVGDLVAPPEDGLMDLVVCNGLIGGPACHSERDLAAAWDAIRARLRPGGRLIVGDSFHAGHASTVARFHTLVRERHPAVAVSGGSVLYLC